jgi:hypothetical protein
MSMHNYVVALLKSLSGYVPFALVLSLSLKLDGDSLYIYLSMLELSMLELSMLELSMLELSMLEISVLELSVLELSVS